MKRVVLTAVASVCTAFAGFCAEASAARVRLAEDGKAIAEIVISARAGRSVRFGAEDLKWHLKKMTGADFAVVTDDAPPSGRYEIRVGESKRTRAKKSDFTFQQYLVDVGLTATELVGWDEDKPVDPRHPPRIADREDGSLALESLPGMFDKHGSLYAVYQFLEDVVGVKWVDCTEYGTLIPKRPTLELEVFSRRYEPFAAYRGGTIESGLKTSCWGAWTDEFAAYEKMAYVNPKAARTYSWLYLLRHRTGGRYAQCNHSLYYFFDFYWDRKSPRFKAFHPEYFASGTEEGAVPTQLCYSRQDVVDRVAADIASYFDATNANRSTPMYSGRIALGTLMKFWGDDNCALEPMDNGTYCNCPECSRLLEIDRKAHGGGNSTMWFTFVKRVAEKLQVTNPGCTITTLAYSGHERLPVDVRLPKNVQVVFCLSGNRCSPRSKGFEAQFDRLRQWRAAYPDQPMGVWFYNVFCYEFYDNARFQGVHCYYAHEAAKQYRELKRLNVRQGVFHCGLSGAIAQYVNCALMLDPEADVDRLLDEYFSQFGTAAADLRAFYDRVEERFCNEAYRNKELKSGPENPAQCWKYMCPPEVLAELGKLIERAQSRNLSDLERKRVELFKLANWDYMKKGSEIFHLRGTYPQPTWQTVKVPEAGGDLKKVAWDRVPEQPLMLYQNGGDKPAGLDFKCGYRIANDANWLYLEFVQHRSTEVTTDLMAKGVVFSRSVAPYDTWELMLAAQRALPYRYFICGANSRMWSLSYGEVNFRMNVDSKESGCEHWGAKMESDISSGRKWVSRWAFPLATMIDRPLNPGDVFYMNPCTVLHPGACGGARPYGIFSPVSYSSAHTYDRAIEVRLAK